MKYSQLFSLAGTFFIFSAHAMQQNPSQKQFLVPYEFAEQQDDTQPSISLHKLYFMHLVWRIYDSPACNDKDFQILLAQARAKDNKFETSNALEKVQLTRKQLFAGLLANLETADNAPFQEATTSRKIIISRIRTHYGTDIHEAQITFNPNLASPTEIHIENDKYLLTLKDIPDREQVERLRAIRCIQRGYENSLEGKVYQDGDEPEDFGCPIS